MIRADVWKRFSLREPPSASPTVECLVCRSDLPSESFLQRKTTNECDHPNTICTTCLHRHIEVEVNGKGETIEISCPSLGCRKLLLYEDVKQSASAAVFARYDALLLRKMLQKIEDFRWCKRADCGSGQIHDGGGGNPIMTCAACKEKSCFTHDLPWHYEYTCDQFEAARSSNVNNIASLAYFSSKTKPCPECSSPIEKVGGCDHMTCECGYEFCWLCLADYEQIMREGNHHHRETCQYYAAYDSDLEEEETNNWWGEQ